MFGSKGAHWAAVVLASWLCAFSSRAQQVEPPVGEGLEPSSVAEGAPEKWQARIPLVWKRWALFDPFMDPHEAGLAFEWNDWREIDSGVRSRGVTIALASQVSTVRRHLASTIRMQSVALRVLEGPTFALGLLQYDLLGSLDLGVVRLGGGAGLLPIAIDYGRSDFSIALASPRAIASLSFKIGPARIALSAVTSYLPRVWGRGDVIANSLTLEFLFEKPRAKKRGNHPLLIR